MFEHGRNQAAYTGSHGLALRSNHSDARSRSTAGANGRKLSRNLILRFMVACIAGERGSPRILRAPKDLGPNSIRPWNQPTILPSASKCGYLVEQISFVGKPPSRCAVHC